MTAECDACGQPGHRLYLHESGGSFCKTCYARDGETDRYGNSITVSVDPEEGVTIENSDGEVVSESSGFDRTIALVGCGAAKRDEAAPARELYTSTYAGLKARYGEERVDEWVVLSAEHGIVAPDEVLESYDTSIGDLDGEERVEWAADVLAELDEWISWDARRSVTVELLAGQQYLEPLEDGLQSLPVEVRRPFDDTSGIGEQMAWLSEQLGEEGSA